MTTSSNHSVPERSKLSAFDFEPELTRLEYLLEHNIPGYIAECCEPDSYILSGFAKDLKKERARIEFLWAKMALNQKKESNLHADVQLRQREVIQLMGMLLRYVEPSELFDRTIPVSTALYKYIFKTLRQLLLFLEDHFHHQMDWDMYLPGDYLRIVSYEIRNGLEELKATLLASTLEKTTMKVVRSAFEKLGRGLEGEVSFSHVTYLRRLKNQLEFLSFQQKKKAGVQTKSADVCL